MPDTPTFDDVLRALGDWTTALSAESIARTLSEAAGQKFEAVYAAFRGTHPPLSGEETARLVQRLQEHAGRLEQIAAPERSKAMPVPQNLQDALAKIDQDTDAVAQVVRSLRDQIGTGMTQADVDAVQARLDEIANRLEATAADPNQPVPPGPPPAP